MWCFYILFEVLCTHCWYKYNVMFICFVWGVMYTFLMISKAQCAHICAWGTELQNWPLLLALFSLVIRERAPVLSLKDSFGIRQSVWLRHYALAGGPNWMAATLAHFARNSICDVLIGWSCAVDWQSGALSVLNITWYPTWISTLACTFTWITTVKKSVSKYSLSARSLFDIILKSIKMSVFD